jgi:hypothetical protein
MMTEDERTSVPAAWDNVSNDYWVYRNVYDLFAMWFFFQFMSIAVVLMSAMLFGIVSFLISIPVGYAIMFITGDEVYLISTIYTVTGIFTLLATGYTTYAFFSVKNKWGRWYYSTVKTPRIFEGNMLKLIEEFLGEYGYHHNRRFYWLIGNRWHVFRIRDKGIQLKVCYNRSQGGFLYQFHLGPIGPRTEIEVEMLKESFSQWATENIRPIVGEFPVHSSNDSNMSLKL